MLADRLSDDDAERDAPAPGAARRLGAARGRARRPGCLDRAAELARAHPLRIVDAIHLAAADRLPRPVTYATFDDHQIPVALALGFDVVSA